MSWEYLILGVLVAMFAALLAYIIWGDEMEQ